MSNETIVTIRGNVAADPKMFKGEGKTPFAALRVASTPRRFNRGSEKMEDGPTEWFTVKTFGELATNVAESLHRGQPVLVRGRLQTETYTAKDSHDERLTLVIVADSVAIDLTYGTAKFVKTVRGAKAEEGEHADEEAMEPEPVGAAF